jgi:F0F1-type ATP synthase membrane subunit a
MFLLFLFLGYFIPLIVVLLGVYYYELESGETFKECFAHNETLLLATVVPVFNIIGMIAVIITPIVRIIGNIKKS